MEQLHPYKTVGVITDPTDYFNDCLIKTPLQLGHGLFITSYINDRINYLSILLSEIHDICNREESSLAWNAWFVRTFRAIIAVRALIEIIYISRSVDHRRIIMDCFKNKHD